jgi:hypothetical protein
MGMLLNLFPNRNENDIFNEEILVSNLGFDFFIKLIIFSIFHQGNRPKRSTKRSNSTLQGTKPNNTKKSSNCLTFSEDEAIITKKRRLDVEDLVLDAERKSLYYSSLYRKKLEAEVCNHRLNSGFRSQYHFYVAICRKSWCSKIESLALYKRISLNAVMLSCMHFSTK